MQRHAPSGSKAIQLTGWVGVLLVLISYILLTFGVFHPGDVWYQLMNVFGACAIIIETRSRRDYQPMTLNIIWAIVALYGLVAAVGR